MTQLGTVAAAAEELPDDTGVASTGRTMKVPWFAEHMREELVLHGWDITGDDPAAQSRLGQWWMTEHSVNAVGVPLLERGAQRLGLDDEDHVESGCVCRAPTSLSLPAPTAHRSGGCRRRTGNIDDGRRGTGAVVLGTPAGQSSAHPQRRRAVRTGQAPHPSQRLLSPSLPAPITPIRCGQSSRSRAIGPQSVSARPTIKASASPTNSWSLSS